MEEMVNQFWAGKRVFVTGHTGFKGAWLCKVLSFYGAVIKGYALNPPTTPNLFEIANVADEITSFIGDIRNAQQLADIVLKAEPEIIFHMAAQPIVREGYNNPIYTYETNVMGTVNILDAVRQCESVRSFVNITTDKVYQNNEWVWGYRENDALDGYDPYSNSKSCSELITGAYKRSFLEKVAVSTCRSGNVIGGGDFAADRIIPDCVRAAYSGEEIIIRNPEAVRPYQHVLESIFAYMLVARKQYEQPEKFQNCYNIGPDNNGLINSAKLATMFCEKWGNNTKWKASSQEGAPHEANVLALDCTKIKNTIGWKPLWDINEAVEKTIEWSHSYYNYNKENINSVMERQIDEYIREVSYDI